MAKMILFSCITLYELVYNNIFSNHPTLTTRRKKKNSPFKESEIQERPPTLPIHPEEQLQETRECIAREEPLQKKTKRIGIVHQEE